MTDRRNDYYSNAPFHEQLVYWGPICRLCVYFPFHESPGSHWCERRGTEGKFVRRNTAGRKTCYQQIDEGEFLLRMDTQRARDAEYVRTCNFNYKSVRRIELCEKQRIYVSLNREKVLAKKREHYFLNRDRVSDYHREYYQKHREIILTKRKTYYASLTEEQINRRRNLKKKFVFIMKDETK